MSLLTELERDEAYRAIPYPDTERIWTFAIGRNLEANPLTGPEWKALLDASEISVSISRAGANRLLLSGSARAQSQCAAAFGWWPGTDEVRRDVLANLCFNMGMQRLVGFKNMLAAMKAGDYEVAAQELEDSHWFEQVGNRGPRLVDQLRTGVRT